MHFHHPAVVNSLKLSNYVVNEDAIDTAVSFVVIVASWEPESSSIICKQFALRKNDNKYHRSTAFCMCVCKAANFPSIPTARLPLGKLIHRPRVSPKIIQIQTQLMKLPRMAFCLSSSLIIWAPVAVVKLMAVYTYCINRFMTNQPKIRNSMESNQIEMPWWAFAMRLGDSVERLVCNYMLPGTEIMYDFPQLENN